MAYTNEDLKAKIFEMYPQIAQHGITVSLNFSQGKDAYVVTLQKEAHELMTHLEKKDADDCMNDVKCVYLGVQIGQFVHNFELGT
jgi:hypothetical protein